MKIKIIEKCWIDYTADVLQWWSAGEIDFFHYLFFYGPVCLSVCLRFCFICNSFYSLDINRNEIWIYGFVIIIFWVNLDWLNFKVFILVVCLVIFGLSEWETIILVSQYLILMDIMVFYQICGHYDITKVDYGLTVSRLCSNHK